ncbi:hypothetical protein WJX72_001098 [[Myrmecia] bisecta]|uniref:F-box domain-containing protein n=1 Tax=[Myrmecia] bisecta TaxID=41462 RepID=A0AAW1PD93_9CHLO
MAHIEITVLQASDPTMDAHSTQLPDCLWLDILGRVGALEANARGLKLRCLMMTVCKQWHHLLESTPLFPAGIPVVMSSGDLATASKANQQLLYKTLLSISAIGLELGILVGGQRLLEGAGAPFWASYPIALVVCVLALWLYLFGGLRLISRW